MEAFVKVYLYRKDLFEDPKVKEAFKAKYGRDLAPAKTHAEYRDIAEFFTEWGKDNDLELWGTTVQAHTGHPGFVVRVLRERRADLRRLQLGHRRQQQLRRHRRQRRLDEQPEGQGRARPGGSATSKYAPPESTSSTWDEVAATFAAGRAAQGLVYGENAAWIATNASQVEDRRQGRRGPAADRARRASPMPKSGKGYIGYYDGGAFGIPASSKNKEAALLFLEFIGQPSVQADWAVAGSRIRMTATYDDPEGQGAWTRRSTTTTR